MRAWLPLNGCYKRLLCSLPCDLIYSQVFVHLLGVCCCHLALVGAVCCIFISRSVLVSGLGLAGMCWATKLHSALLCRGMRVHKMLDSHDSHIHNPQANGHEGLQIPAFFVAFMDLNATNVGTTLQNSASLQGPAVMCSQRLAQFYAATCTLQQSVGSATECCIHFRGGDPMCVVQLRVEAECNGAMQAASSSDLLGQERPCWRRPLQLKHKPPFSA